VFANRHNTSSSNNNNNPDAQWLNGMLVISQTRGVPEHSIQAVKQVMDARISSFVEFELDKYYKRLISFVKNYEPIISASSAPENERIDRGTMIARARSLSQVEMILTVACC
jgi:hypothetical protein